MGITTNEYHKGYQQGCKDSKEYYKTRLKADMVAILDKIREEIINPNEMDKLENSNLWQKWFLNLIDKYKAESEG